MQDSQSFRPFYDPTAVQPMRDELVKIGIRELRTPEEVDEVLGSRTGTQLLVVNLFDPSQLPGPRGELREFPKIQDRHSGNAPAGEKVPRSQGMDPPRPVEGSRNAD